MAYEMVQFSPVEGGPPFGRIAVGTAAITFAAGTMLSGSMGVGGLWAITGLVLMLIGILIWLIQRNKEVCGNAKAHLTKQGNEVDFQLGNALIDSRAKVIAFVDVNKRTYDRYCTRDILGLEHQWVNKTTASGLGNNIVTNTRQIDNVVVFKTNNPAKPLYKVPVGSYEAGELWMARLGAIING